MRQRERSGTAVFLNIGEPAKNEIDAAQYLLLAVERRIPPGTRSPEYMRLALGIEALLDANEALSPDEPQTQLWAYSVTAIASVLGTIFGSSFDPSCWHEQVEILTRDLYATAREQRRMALGEREDG